MEVILDIGDVARRTGLTLRALRFYEARGIVRPLRTAGGRRAYGPGELARLNAAVALRRAGFTLSQIAAMLGDRRLDLRTLVAAQIAALDARADELAQSRALLCSVQSRIDRGEPIDVATLCSLIDKGNRSMEQQQWKAVIDRYYTPGQQAEWQAQMAAVSPDFDSESYRAKWRELSDRIAAALPMAPGSDAAQAFVDAWFALLKPFSQVATQGMWEGAKAMYGDMDRWEGQADPGFSPEVWRFIAEATRWRIAQGGAVDGPDFAGTSKA